MALGFVAMTGIAGLVGAAESDAEADLGRPCCGCGEAVHIGENIHRTDPTWGQYGQS